MLFAIVDGKPVLAGPAAPQWAKCLYCGESVFLRHHYNKNNDEGYTWLHNDKDEQNNCQQQRQITQDELNRSLGIK